MLEKFKSQDTADNHLIKLITELLETSVDEVPDIIVRNKFVFDITEEYYCKFGCYPSSYILSKLADYLMLDHFKSPLKNKMKSVPVLTPRQQKTRDLHESILGIEVIDSYHSRNKYNFAKRRITKERDEN